MLLETYTLNYSGWMIGFPARLIPLFIILALLGIRAGNPPPVLSAAALPAGFTDTQVVTGLSSPTAMAIAPDGRIFVCQQEGQLRVVKNGALLATPFLSLTVSSGGERGLLGVAFDPDFAANQFVYVYYTTSTAPVRHRVSRFTANGDVAAPGSEAVFWRSTLTAARSLITEARCISGRTASSTSPSVITIDRRILRSSPI